MPSVLVTGATGFIGSHLVPALSTRYKVTALTRKISRQQKIKELAAFAQIISIDECSLTKLFEENQFQAVIHLATEYGRTPETSALLHEANVDFPARILKIAQSNNCKVFINTDTFFQKYSPECEYLKAYRETKLTFRTLLDQSSVRKITLQLEHVYGSKDAEDKFIPQLLKKLLKNESTIPLTAGEQRRDFIHVSDVVSAYLSVLESALTSANMPLLLEVGTGINTSIHEFALLAKKTLNSSSELAFGALPYREHELFESKAQIDPLRSLGWDSKISLTQGIKEAAASLG